MKNSWCPMDIPFGLQFLVDRGLSHKERKAYFHPFASWAIH